MQNVTELRHPLVGHHLTVLRDKNTSSAQFRQQTNRLATLLAYEATADLPLGPKPVETPIEAMHGQQISSRIALVPILRAGLGLVEPVLDLLPDAEVWHLGMYRDEETSQPVEYYCKLPADKPTDIGFVLDPMLATGGSVLSAIAALKRWGCRDIRVLSVIASRSGIERLLQEFPDVRTVVCQIDETLNSQNFIVPGLGDAGDRIFNT